MTVAKLQVAVDDPLVAEHLRLAPEQVRIVSEPFYLDGPVSARLAVVDRDPDSGSLARSVRWNARALTYDCPDDITDREAVAVSVFGLVLKTLSAFERQDVLGRQLSWQFGPQLLIVPRAGVWENAFYDRYSRSLQFYYFPAKAGHVVHTALSRDIVTHETGHAILDAIAPALYDALNPETLALHESIGDLTAICMTLESPTMRNWLVKHRKGELSGTSPASELANEFGEAFNAHHPLRNADNTIKRTDVEEEPHALSEVLTGAVWKAMAAFHAHALAEARKQPDPSETLRSRALGISARQIARILFRALDFVPPAEATFGDYLRAILRSDRLAQEEDVTGYRQALVDEAVERKIVRGRRELAHDPPAESIRVNLDELIDSDWTAYDFVHRNRKLLGVPPNVPFRLFPRRDLNRLYYTGNRQKLQRREVTLAVTWEEPEENGIVGLPSRRAVFRGTTLVLSGDQDRRGYHRILSCLTNESGERQVAMRSRTLRRLADQGQLLFSHGTKPAELRPLAPIASARVSNDTMRLRGTARLLHLARWDR